MLTLFKTHEYYSHLIIKKTIHINEKCNEPNLIVKNTTHTPPSIPIHIIHPPIKTDEANKKAPESKSVYPEDIKVQRAEFSDVDGVVALLRGQDAVVCALGSFSLNPQDHLINAAIKAGVKRFIVSDVRDVVAICS